MVLIQSSNDPEEKVSVFNMNYMAHHRGFTPRVASCGLRVLHVFWYRQHRTETKRRAVQGLGSTFPTLARARLVGSLGLSLPARLFVITCENPVPEAVSCSWVPDMPRID